MRTSILRALLAIVVGALMIVYRAKIVQWLIVAIGILFILSGLISVVYYCVMRRKYDKDKVREEYASKDKKNMAHKPIAPIVGVGCALLGLILTLIPTTIADYLTYVFAILLILGAISQFYLLISATTLLRDLEKTVQRKLSVSCSYVYWVMPILLFLFGLLAILYPHAIESAPFLFIGIAMVVYGLSEIVNAIKARSVRKYVVNADFTPAPAVSPEPEHIEYIEPAEEVHEEAQEVKEDVQEVEVVGVVDAEPASNVSVSDGIEEAEVISPKEEE